MKDSKQSSLYEMKNLLEFALLASISVLVQQSPDYAVLRSTLRVVQ